MDENNYSVLITGVIDELYKALSVVDKVSYGN